MSRKILIFSEMFFLELAHFIYIIKHILIRSHVFYIVDRKYELKFLCKLSCLVDPPTMIELLQ